jgi:hypothetical protein
MGQSHRSHLFFRKIVLEISISFTSAEEYDSVNRWKEMKDW